MIQNIPSRILVTASQSIFGVRWHQEEIRAQIDPKSEKFCIKSKTDLLQWSGSTPKTRPTTITSPFIIDLEGNLWIADRHSEHVACARGKDVLAAGEMMFLVERGGVVVVEVTNQSTGYCPEPECWIVYELNIHSASLIHSFSVVVKSAGQSISSGRRV